MLSIYSLRVNFGVLIRNLFLHVASIFDSACFVNKSAILAAFDKHITTFSCLNSQGGKMKCNVTFFVGFFTRYISLGRELNTVKLEMFADINVCEFFILKVFALLKFAILGLPKVNKQCSIIASFNWIY